MRKLTTMQLEAETKVPRGSINKLVKQLGLKPVGQTVSKKRTLVWLWPQSAVDRILRYTEARDALRAMRRGKKR